MSVIQTETLLEKTDRMLQVMASRPFVATEKAPSRDAASLWDSGLTSGLLFSVGEPPADSLAESEAQSIVMRHLQRTKRRPENLAITDMVDFQHALQSRAKVMSAIEMLMCG